jgi:hypothetical protein
VAHGGRYVLRGAVSTSRLVENYFTLWDEAGNTLSHLAGAELKLDAAGRFAIAVDGEAPGDRPNHIFLPPGARQFFIRDVLGDWSAERPNTLSVERLGPAPRRAPRTEPEQARASAALIQEYVENSIRWNRPPLSRPANSFAEPIVKDTDQWLRNQAYALGRFELADDAVLVLTLRPGRARYFCVPITNFWGTSNEVVSRTGSLNRAQSVPDADGSYRFAIALEDPGVHNWVDPCGLREGVVTVRWAEFPGGAPAPGEIGLEARVVPRARLRAELPTSTRWVDAAQRRAQLAARARDYAWRLAQG